MIEGQDEAATSRLRVLHGEVMGLRQDRTEDAARALLTADLTGRQRAAITAVCTDMHRPYLNAVGEVVKDAEVVFDKFHVLQHASAGSTTCGGKNSFARAR
jgi:transposase